MFWQSVEELEADKDMRRKENKEDRMRRQGMEALKNIEDAKKEDKKKDGKEFCLQWPKKGTPHVRQDGGRFSMAWA